jgi:hypothetical protein
VPLGDGDEKDKRENLCVDVVMKDLPRGKNSGGKRVVEKYPLPRCMDMITAEEVACRVKLYFAGGALEYLTPRQARLAKNAMALGKRPSNSRGADRRADARPQGGAAVINELSRRLTFLQLLRNLQDAAEELMVVSTERRLASEPALAALNSGVSVPGLHERRRYLHLGLEYLAELVGAQFADPRFII